MKYPYNSPDKEIGPIGIFSYKIAIFPNIKCNQDIPSSIHLCKFLEKTYIQFPLTMNCQFDSIPLIYLPE